MWFNKWNVTSDPCEDSWYGVMCDSSNSAVLQLSLGSNNLSGALPDNIFVNLTLLEQVNFSYNFLHGSMPMSIGSLTQSRRFSISDNLLQGDIPESIVGMLALKYLDVGSNYLTGALPSSLVNMINLTIFQFF